MFDAKAMLSFCFLVFVCAFLLFHEVHVQTILWYDTVNFPILARFQNLMKQHLLRIVVHVLPPLREMIRIWIYHQVWKHIMVSLKMPLLLYRYAYQMEFHGMANAAGPWVSEITMHHWFQGAPHVLWKLPKLVWNHGHGNGLNLFQCLNKSHGEKWRKLGPLKGLPRDCELKWGFQ